MYVLRGRPDQKSIGFVLPPRTATRSVVAAIEPLGAVKVGTKHRIPKREPQVDLWVATIRNPLDVIVSWFHFPDKDQPERRRRAGSQRLQESGGNGRTWPEFLEYVLSGEHNWMKDTTLLGAEHASLVIRQDIGVQKGLNFILDYAGYPEVEVPCIGKTERPAAETYYTPEQEAAVREKFKADFERFGY